MERVKELCLKELAAWGYQLLTQSPEAGVDIFAKQLRSHFIFFQGHPEYEALSLQREYLRDISRFLAGERDGYPAVPAGYFDPETEDRLVNFRRRASAGRKPALSAELPILALRPDIAAGAAAAVIFRNWLGYLSHGAAAMAPRATESSDDPPLASPSMPLLSRRMLPRQVPGRNCQEWQPRRRR
jgi:homoserine O-succinyltransferase